MRTHNGCSDMTGFTSFNDSTCKRILNLLGAGYLRLGTPYEVGCINQNYSNYVCSERWDGNMVQAVVKSRYGQIQQTCRI